MHAHCTVQAQWREREILSFEGFFQKWHSGTNSSIKLIWQIPSNQKSVAKILSHPTDTTVVSDNIWLYMMLSWTAMELQNILYLAFLVTRYQHRHERPFLSKKKEFVSCHWCEENEMVFVSYKVPFPATTDRRSRVAGTEWEVKTIQSLHQPVEVNNDLFLNHPFHCREESHTKIKKRNIPDRDRYLFSTE